MGLDSPGSNTPWQPLKLDAYYMYVCLFTFAASCRQRIHPEMSRSEQNPSPAVARWKRKRRKKISVRLTIRNGNYCQNENYYTMIRMVSGYVLRWAMKSSILKVS